MTRTKKLTKIINNLVSLEFQVQIVSKVPNYQLSRAW